MTLLDQWIGLKEHHGTSYYSRVFLWVSRRFSHPSAAGRLLPCHRRRWRRWPPWYRPRAGNDGYLSTVAKQFDYVLKYYNIYNINLYYIYLSLSPSVRVHVCCILTLSYIVLFKYVQRYNYVSYVICEWYKCKSYLSILPGVNPAIHRWPGYHPHGVNPGFILR